MAKLPQTYYTNYFRTGTTTPYATGDWKWRFEVSLISQSTANDSSYVRIRSYVMFANQPSGASSRPWLSYYRIDNGATSYGDHVQYAPSAGNSEYLVNTLYKTIYHTADNPKTFELDLSGGYNYYDEDYSNHTESSNNSITLPAISIYPVVTTELYDVGPDYVKVRYVTYSQADTPQIRLWSGGAWGQWRTAVDNPVLLNKKDDETYLNPSVSGYQVQMQFRHPDSGLWKECDPITFDTLSNNYLTNYPDFTLGSNTFNVSLYNPKSYRTMLYIKDKNSTVLGTRDNITTTTYQLALTEDEVDGICEANPTTNLASYSIDVETYNGDGVKVGATQNKGGTCTIVNANPIFSNFTYEDINSKTVALTGGNDTDGYPIIKGYSNLRAIVSVANKAAAQKGATMVKYRLVVGAKQIDVNYSDSADVNLDINAIDNNMFTVYAIDSRGNSISKQISPSAYLDYSPINIINSVDKPTIASRTDSTGEETTLTLNGSIWNGNFGSVTNSIKTCTYKYKKVQDTTYTDGVTALTPTLSDNTYSLSSLIAGDLGALGFNVGFSYNIQITVTDELSTKTYDLQPLQTATPSMDIFEEGGVSFGSPYDEGLGGPIQAQVDGKNYKLLTTNDGIAKGTILWTNGSPTSGFNAQTVTVSDMSDYDIIGIWFWRNTTNDSLQEVRVKKGYGGSFAYFEMGTTYVQVRDFAYSSATQILFKDGRLNTGVDNTRAIPMYVVGYKRGLF
jgi:hypothetical protein